MNLYENIINLYLFLLLLIMMNNDSNVQLKENVFRCVHSTFISGMKSNNIFYIIAELVTNCTRAIEK